MDTSLLLDRYKLVTLGASVGEGVGKAIYAEVSTVAKTNTDMIPYCVPNEVVCGAIARALLLPVPLGAVVRTAEPELPFYYGSLDFNLTGESLPPVDPDDFIAELADICTGICLFDILVMNSDRHRGNLSVDLESNPKRLVCFDHSHALFGAIKGQAEGAVTGSHSHLSRFGADDHCLIPELPTDKYFAKWLDRIEQLPRFQIEGFCRSADGLGVTKVEVEAAINCLLHRKENMSRIVEDNRRRFRAI